jgi:hypothetical protein
VYRKSERLDAALADASQAVALAAPTDSAPISCAEAPQAMPALRLSLPAGLWRRAKDLLYRSSFVPILVARLEGCRRAVGHCEDARERGSLPAVILLQWPWKAR